MQRRFELTHELLARLSDHQPRRLPSKHPSGRRAATAIVLHRDGSGLDVLLMKRSERDDDPWSGHISFPGGHSDLGDVDLAMTARREAFEEIGITVDIPFGRLDDVRVHAANGTVVSPFLFSVATKPELVVDPNEVDRAFWMPLTHTEDSAHRCVHVWRRHGVLTRYPGLRFDGELIWGLTYRCLAHLVEWFGVRLPLPQDLI